MPCTCELFRCWYALAVAKSPAAQGPQPRQRPSPSREKPTHSGLMETTFDVSQKVLFCWHSFGMQAGQLQFGTLALDTFGLGGFSPRSRTDQCEANSTSPTEGTSISHQFPLHPPGRHRRRRPGHIDFACPLLFTLTIIGCWAHRSQCSAI